MAFSRHIIDVLADEGYQWVIVPSHHISRTCPTYFDRFNLASGQYGIYSSPPNRADLLGPSPTSGWWYGEPNPGNAAWNVAPYAYQLHKAKYVNPETGAEKTIITVPSDDVLSYRFGYANEGIGKIHQFIAPFANDPNRPVIVMPSTDGDNAWGGGSSSWFEATPQFFNGSASAGYVPTTPQDFVNAFGSNAQLAHIEDGAWIFPESDYGSPYFLKWIEPPVASANSTAKVPGTVIDMETPGFALKFWSWAPVITGANWVQTAEQILRDEGGSVQAWKIQAPYDWDGSWTNPNEVELAWHIYLAGLDSGFNYYGGLGNDDEVKPALATTRAIQKLLPWMTQSRRANDRTPPSVLKPQRFPYNPGGYTFGWFNSIPGGNTSYLKKMPSEFYIWTHAYDLSGIPSGGVRLKVRLDNDGINPLHDNQNETYAGGPDVGSWFDIIMTKRTLPNDQASLNAAANNGQINYFITPPELADYYFARIANASVPGFRGRLLDYYIEATDSRGNVHKSDIQHVFVEDDGAISSPPATPAAPTASPASSSRIDLTWSAISEATGYRLYRNGALLVELSGTSYSDTGLPASTTFAYSLRAFNSAGESAASPETYASTPAPPSPPPSPTGLAVEALSPSVVSLTWQGSVGATRYLVYRNGALVAETDSTSYFDTGLSASTAYAYYVVAGNEGGNSLPTPSISVTTSANTPSFTLGSPTEPLGYLVDSPGMRLFAAVRGTLLYVATWTPSGGANDHFVLVSDSLQNSATSPAPWGKAGLTALPAGKPYLAAESQNNFIGWFHAAGNTWRDATPGGRMEGVIDLVQTFGRMPDRLFFAALAYQTFNSGLLAAQSPLGNSDGNVSPEEFLEFPIAALRDSAANGTFDRLDPTRQFRIQNISALSDRIRIELPVIPGRSYRLLVSSTMSSGSWQELASFTAASGEDVITLDDPDGVNSNARFYRFEAN